jgi:hypothetical protein
MRHGGEGMKDYLITKLLLRNCFATSLCIQEAGTSW